MKFPTRVSISIRKNPSLVHRTVRRILFFLWATLPALAFALTPVTVQLGWKHQFEFAAFYAAQVKGFYEDAGLAVSILEVAENQFPLKSVVNGTAQFGVGNSGLIVDRARGEPVVVLAAMMQHSPTALLASRRRGIVSIHDLAGKSLSSVPHNRDEIQAFLRASGLALDQVGIIDETDWHPESVHEGKAPAKVVYLSNEPYWLKGQEHDFLLFTPRSAGVDLFGNLLFTAEKTLKEDPAMVAAFRSATLKGWAYALAHPEEIAEVIRRQFNSQNKSLAHLLFEAEQIRELTRPDLVEVGYMSPGRWRHVADVYASLGRIPQDFPLEDFLYQEQRTAEIPAWLWNMLAVLSFGILFLLGIAHRTRLLNRRLREEISEHLNTARALQTSESNYRELIDNANALILRMTLDGTVTYFNERAEAFFGYRSEEIIGRHVVGTIVPETDSSTGASLKEMIDALLTSPSLYEQNENENITRSGLRVTVSWRNKCILDKEGKPLGLLCIGEDITARKRLEQELDEYRQSLENQVQKRTQELKQAKEAAETANNAKSVFLANISHEIRTPLNAIHGMVNLLQRSTVTPEQAVRLHKVERAGQHLLNILNAVLDLSKIEAEKLVLKQEALDVRVIGQDVIDILHIKAEEKGLPLVLEIPEVFREEALLGDALRVQQAWLNYGANAIKFTEHGQIVFRVRPLEEWQDSVLLRFEVEDSGIGLTDEHVTRLFQPFEQVENSLTRKYGGTGLGLSITKKLAEAMGGTVGVERAGPQGSLFWFSARFAKGQTEADGSPPLSAEHNPTDDIEVLEAKITQHFSGAEVLLVDDEPINLEIAEAFLTAIGLRVDRAENGREAVDKVAANPERYVLICMDMQMPVMNGLEACRAIRAWRTPKQLPILALTANAFHDNQALCLQEGMNDFVAKPIDPGRLLQSVWACLEGRLANQVS